MRVGGLNWMDTALDEGQMHADGGADISRGAG